MNEELAYMGIGLPLSLKEELQYRASANRRTLNSEVLVMLESMIDGSVDSSKHNILDMEGLTVEQLQARREEYKRAGGDNPTCPACNKPFARKTWQDVFCSPEHRDKFNNQIRQLKRAF
jgi:hypothetical protein